MHEKIRKKINNNTENGMDGDSEKKENRTNERIIHTNAKHTTLYAERQFIEFTDRFYILLLSVCNCILSLPLWLYACVRASV